MFSPPERISVFTMDRISYPWKVPWNTAKNCLRFLNRAFQSTVGESVALVEVKIAFIGKEALSIRRWYVFDVVGGDDDS